MKKYLLKGSEVMETYATVVKVTDWEGFHKVLESCLTTLEQLQIKLTTTGTVSNAVLLGFHLKSLSLICKSFCDEYLEQMNSTVITFWQALQKFLTFIEMGLEREVALALTLELKRLLRLALPYSKELICDGFKSDS